MAVGSEQGARRKVPSSEVKEVRQMGSTTMWGPRRPVPGLWLFLSAVGAPEGFEQWSDMVWLVSLKARIRHEQFSLIKCFY